MKTIKITTLVAAILFGHAALAQDEQKGKQKIYTPEQLEMLKAQKDAVKENREEFKASLTDEQRAILENKELKKILIHVFPLFGYEASHIIIK